MPIDIREAQRRVDKLMAAKSQLTPPAQAMTAEALVLDRQVDLSHPDVRWLLSKWAAARQTWEAERAREYADEAMMDVVIGWPPDASATESNEPDERRKERARRVCKYIREIQAERAAMVEERDIALQTAIDWHKRSDKQAAHIVAAEAALAELKGRVADLERKLISAKRHVGMGQHTADD